MFEKGNKLSPGRPVGSVNKDKLAAREICAKHGIDLFEASIMLAMQLEDGPVKLDKFIALLPYTNAKLSNVNLGIDPEKNSIKVVIEDYRSK
jgi:hypothetical protein